MATGSSYRPLGTLPPQMSLLVGRDAEVARVQALLRTSRLVTVAGPGGVGKTRLAVRVAESMAADFTDGVHFIELSAVRDPGLLGPMVAAILAAAELVSPEPDQGAQLDRLLGLIAGHRLLLVLDTCEHLVDGCAALADTILQAAPGITVLATSRQPLDAAGEAVFQLSPLPVPDPGSELAGQADAVELFAQRAAAVLPGFTVTRRNLADIITVCRRLDGIPLAIELATMRLRALPLHQMAERIDDRLRLLTGGRRSGTPRHQTLRAAIDWSYSLCTPAEQLLWARLSVFAGGFDLTAAEAVGVGGGLAAEEIVPAVISLVDKNVLARGDAPGTGPFGEAHPAALSFRMPDTLREFGAERLHQADLEPAGAGQPGAQRADGPAGRLLSTVRPGRCRQPAAGHAAAAVRRRFVAYYLALAERFEIAPAADQLAWYRRLRREHANLRAAFDYALELPGNDSAAVALATSLFVYWRISGLLREAEHWLDQAADRCPARSAAGARVLGTRGYVRVLLGDFASGQADAEAAVTMAATFGDQSVGGRGYSALHRAAAFRGRLDEAQQAGQSAAACFASVGDALGLAQLDVVDAMLRLQDGDPTRCCQSASVGLARIADGELWCTAQLHQMLALGLFLQGEIDRARPPASQALEIQHLLNDETGIAFSLGTLAFIAAGEGRYQRTAWLVGASAPMWERTGRWYTGSPAFESLHEIAERVARAGLGDDQFWQLRAAGAAAPLDLAVRRALSDTDEGIR